MEDIIKNDLTLNYFINEAHIDWFNDWQVTLRFKALEIAYYKYIDKLYEKHRIN